MSLFDLFRAARSAVKMENPSRERHPDNCAGRHEIGPEPAAPGAQHGACDPGTQLDAAAEELAEPDAETDRGGRDVASLPKM